MLNKTKFWIILFSALFIVGCVAFLLLRGTGGGTVAKVWLDGEIVRTIDLSAVASPYDFTVESELGTNTVHVEHGAISIAEADCRDQICVKQGDITTSAIPIVCMPHHLVIEIEGER